MKRKLSKEQRSNIRPLDLTPFKIVQQYFIFTEYQATSPKEQALRDQIRKNALDHDILLGFFP